MRSSTERYLPPAAIQVFGALIVTAITVAGLVGVGNPTILLAVLAVASGFVLLGGFYEKLRQDVRSVITPPPPRDPTS